MGTGLSAASSGIRSVAAASAALLLAAALMMPSGGARAANETVVFSFAGPPFEFSAQGPLLSDATGALYGTTAGGGASGCGILPGSSVFKLAPPAAPGGRWTKTILHGDSDGFLPGAGLVSDPAGNLYGTTEPGCIGEPGGTVFRLEKPARPGDAWVLTVLHTFNTFSDGFPPGGLIRDAAGALYGTTAFGGSDGFCSGRLTPGSGTVFKLTPPANAGGSWTESVLHRFACGDGAFPEVALLAGASGKLYGTTFGDGSATCSRGGCGMVFELDPPAPAGAAWTKTVLHRFKGGADGIAPTGLIAHAGSLYGTTQAGGGPGCSTLFGETGCGTVFRLTPPATTGQPWTETVLYRFQGPNDGAYPNPLTYRRGVFYGTTSAGGASKHCEGGCGSAFALTPPVAGAVWSEKIIHSFKGFTREGADGAGPNGALVAGKDGRFYGATSAGGANDDGTIFAIVP
jgi:uncharacterized repeat protein (TIGR03803 family)